MTQTFDRFNKIIGELATVGVKMDQDDINRKFLRSLGDEWTMYTVSYRQSDNLEEKELDDLYNDLRVFETEVEIKKKPTGYVHNSALLSAATDTTAIPEAVSTASGASSEKGTETIFEAFLSSHSNNSLINDDLDQLHPDDLEEMDIKWQMAMLSMRVNKFIKRTGRNNFSQRREDGAGFDKTKVECYKCHMKGHFARECRSAVPNNNHQQAQNGGYTQNKNPAQALVSQQGMGFDWSDQAEEVIQNQALMAEVSDLPSEVISNLCTKSCIDTVKRYRDHNQSMCDDLKRLEKDRRDYVLIVERFEEQIKGFLANELQHSYDTNYWKWEKNELETKLSKSLEERDRLKEELSKVKLDIEKFSYASKAMDSLLKAQIHDKMKPSIGYNSTPPPYNNNYISPTSDLLETKEKKDLSEKAFKIDPLDEVVIKDLTEKEASEDRDNDCDCSKAKSLNSGLKGGNQRNWNNQWAQKQGVDLSKINRPKPCFICGKLNHLAKYCFFNPINQQMTFQKFVQKPVGNRKAVKKHGEKKGPMKKKILKESIKMWVPKSTKTVSAADRVSAAGSITAATCVSTAENINAANTVSTSSKVNTANTVTAANTVTTANKVSTTEHASVVKGNQQLKGRSIWHVDSGCSRHMTGNMSCLQDFKHINGGHVAFGDNLTGGKISGKGNVTKGKMTFEDVYYVDQLKYNLLSVSQVCDKQHSILFTNTECMILAPGFKVVDESMILLRTPRKDNVYCLDMDNVDSDSSLNCLVSKASIDESSLWHIRMCHMNFKTMNKLVKNNLVRGLPSKVFSCDDHCVACLKGKQHKTSHKTKEINSISSCLQLLHMDLFGPTNVMSIGKKSYCLVIIDDYSRFTWVYFLRTKDETSELIKSFILRIENQTNQKVKVMRSDNGTEFKNLDLNTFCEEKGIERQYSAPRTPQQNGVAERRNRTLIEAARSMLADSKLPITFWAEAVNTACYVQNRVLVVKPKNKTPYELLNKRKPFIGFFKPFGCSCTILNTKSHLGKFDSKEDDGFLVGYSSQSKAYRVFNTSSRIIEESDNVKCNENTPNPIGTGPEWLFDIDSLTNSFGSSSDDYAGSGCGGSGTSQVQESISRSVIFPIPTVNSFEDCEKEPSTGPSQSEEESRDKDTQENKESEVDAENTSVELNDSNLEAGLNEEPSHNTRVQKNHPPQLVIGDISSPMMTRHQTRLQEMHDQQHTVLSCFLSQLEPRKAHDAMKESSWIEAMQEELLQVKLQEVWDLVDLPKGHRAIGTKWIFRNKTDERGIVIRNKVRLVAQGYTQEEGIDYEEVFAPVARIEAIRLFLAYASYMNFKVYQMDVKSVFLYGSIEEEVYVCQPPGFENPSYPDRVYKLKKALYGLHQAPRAWYDTLSSYLLENGFERGVIDKTLLIKRKKKDILLVQIYVDDIIFGSTRDNMCKEFEDLMHQRFKMSSMGELTFFLGLQVQQKSDGIFICQSKYVQDILTKFGFSDSKPASTPMETHKKITADLEGEDMDVHHYISMIGSLMYLTASRPDIMFPVCVSYSDSDLGGANLDRKSTSRGCQFLGARLVSWQCKKQTTVSTSTTEAEYKAAASCCAQVLWIQNQMLDYGVTFLHTPIFIDNSSAISIVNNPVKHSKTKHIEIRYHFIRDCNEKKLVQVVKVHTDNQFADLFTKAFDVGRFTFLGIHSSTQFSLSFKEEEHPCSMASMAFIDEHNEIAMLQKPKQAAGFHQTVDFLKTSHIAHALTIASTIYIEHQRQFWANATIVAENGVQMIKTRVCDQPLTVTEEVIRISLRLDDASGITSIPNDELFSSLARMGYGGPLGVFKFSKAKFSPQWRFFVHTLMHCISKKATGWSEFSSPIAYALVCLATARRYNFSQMIFSDLVSNMGNKKSFFMYPRSVGDSEGVDTPLFSTMMVVSQTNEGMAAGSRPPLDQPTASQSPPSHSKSIPQSHLAKPTSPITQTYKRKQVKKAPSLLVPTSPKPLSPLKENSPLENIHRETKGVSPNPKEVLSEEEEEHMGDEAATTPASTEEESGNINKTSPMATLNEQSFEGPWCQETTGVDSASARQKTSTNKRSNDPSKEGNTSREEEMKLVILSQQVQITKLKKLVTRLVQKRRRKQFVLKKRAKAQDAYTKGENQENETEKESKSEMGFDVEGEIEAEIVKETEFAQEAETVNVAEVKEAAVTGLSVEELEIAETLVKAKNNTPKATQKAKGVVINEGGLQKKRMKQDIKGKGKMVEPEQPSKRRSQIEMDEEMAKQLQEQMEKEEQIQTETDRELAKIMAKKLNAEYQKSLKEAAQTAAQVKKLQVKKMQIQKQKQKRQPSKTFLANQERRKMINFLKGAIGVKVEMFTNMAYTQVEELYQKEMAKLQGDSALREEAERRMKERHDLNIEKPFPEETTPSKEEAEEKKEEPGSVGIEAKSGKRVKSIASKRQLKKPRVEETEKEAEPSVTSQTESIQLPEQSSKPTDESMDPYMTIVEPLKAIPISMQAPEIIFWDILRDNGKNFFRIKRADGSFEAYSTWGKVIRSCSRVDMEELYKVGMKLFEPVLKGTEENLLKVTLEYLCMMFDPERVHHRIKDHKHEFIFKKIDKWILFENCGVYMITIDNCYHEYYLVDKIYEHSKEKLEGMLKATLVCTKDSEMAKIVVRRTVNQSLGLDPNLGN
ncbi:hypothetical protein L6452_06437 [Arctium lappa]|uniref:Uncharacterized protein n=1 Tax=Arctium lappa TaxID=4217 RepID=A0ACB9EJ69_ARCLA|nr:hypothetical protein L6452_06437 [Arctium lappa]